MGVLDPPGVRSVNGQTGNPVLTQKDIGTGTVPVYNIESYGADRAATDGTNTDAMAAAYAAFKVGGGYGVIEIGPGTWTFNKEGYPCLSWDSNHVGRLTIRGAGEGATIIKFGSLSQAMFVWSAFSGSYQFAGNWGNLTIRDLTVDNNNRPSYAWGMQGVIFNFSKGADDFVSLSKIRLQNVSTRNVPRQQSGVPFRESFNIDVGVYNNTEQAWQCNVTDIDLLDFDFGSTGNGGNYGIKMQCFDGRSSVTTNHSPEFLRNGEYRTNTFFDRIRIRAGKHVGGPAQTFFNPCSNIIIGSHGHGGSIIIEDFYARLSGDDGIEVNSFLDTTIRNFQMEDTFSTYAGLFLANLGGMPEPERQTIRIQNGRCFTSATNSGNGTSGDAGIGFTRGASSVGPHGHIVIENVMLDNTGAFITTDFQSLTLRDVTWVDNRDVTVESDGSSSQIFPITIAQLAGTAQLVIDGLHVVYNKTIDNSAEHSGMIFYYGILRVKSHSDLNISMKNLTIDPNFRKLGSAGQIRPKLLSIGSTDVNNISFSGTSASNGRLMWDAGTKDDIAIADGVAKGAGDLTTERRFLLASVGGDFWEASAGLHTDGCTSGKFKPGTTLTGFVAGAVPKSPDPSNYVEGYVYDNGTTSYLCLDKVIAGVRTSIIPDTTLNYAAITSPPSNVSANGVTITRIATGTNFWVRTKWQDETATVDYFTTEVTTASQTGAVTVSATLTGQTNLAALGNGIQGYGGIKWVPISADAELDDVKHYRMNVLSGSIDGLVLLRAPKADQGFGAVGLSGVAASTRIRGALEIANVDCSKWRGVIPTLSDIAITDQTIGTIRLRNIMGATSLVDPLPAFQGGRVDITTSTHTLDKLKSGFFHSVDSATDVTIHLPQDMPVNSTFVIHQKQDGAAVLAADGSATIVSRQGYSKTAGAGAIITLYVTVNAGTAAVYTVAGDGATA